MWMRSIFYFVLAGFCEIGGGYLIWVWLRDNRNGWFGAAGALLLVLYGVIPTFQTENFGRIYAAYGGVFIVLAMFWGWHVDGLAPDHYDWIGAAIILVGVGVIMYWPRSN
jgi:small multidrug resistance family-3 protein